MDWKEFLRLNGDELRRNSDYEVLFVERVLPKVRGIDFDHVSIQTQFTDDQGRQRFIDFTLVEGERVRLAIEMDGYNKDGNGGGITHSQFIDWQQKQHVRIVNVAHSVVAGKDITLDPVSARHDDFRENKTRWECATLTRVSAARGWAVPAEFFTENELE